MLRLRAFSVLGLGIIAASALFGCASGPELEKYPQREIDRPYTLPKGVANWHIPTIYTYAEDEDDSGSFGPLPIPLIWESSLSDDWNLIWYPLPLGLSHQFANTESSKTGFTYLTSFSYGSVSGFRLQPSFSFYHLQKLTKNFGVEIQPSYSPDFAFKRDEDFRWSAGLAAGPFQLTDNFSLKPGLSFRASRGRVVSISDDDLKLSDQTTYTYGVNLVSAWSFARQWDLRPLYSFVKGPATDLTAHVGVIEFVHFW